mmetsp:Transcript_102389/g.293761  ORF Transcript_102389/g.293761 Transcript_102389/m.293761 type:complete len:256 (-) Transcript_102389:328-1095(-)
MLQGLAHRQALLGTETQQPLKEVDRSSLDVRELRLQALALALSEAAQVATGIVALKVGDVCLCRSAQDVEDNAQLVVVGAGLVRLVLAVWRKREAGGAREERAAVLEVRAVEHAQELGVDAANGPQIDGRGVILLQQDQLGGAVPPGDHVSRQVPAVELRLGARQLSPLLGDLATDRARQAKVTDLHRAILVHQAIRRLQVSVVDARGVEVLDADQQVVQKGVDVQWRQRDICAAQLLQVRVADLHDQIQLIEVG